MQPPQVHIILYRWAGRRFFWEIGSECAECDESVQCIQELLTEEFSDAPIRFEVKNWLDNFFEALRHMGWHAPIILINGKRFSQGKVPPRDSLARSIQALLPESRDRRGLQSVQE